jgi:hypothetical protein
MAHLDSTESRWRDVLDMSMRLLDLTDASVAKRVGQGRTWVTKRRSHSDPARIRPDDVGALAEALGVERSLFDLDAIDAGMWLLTHRREECGGHAITLPDLPKQDFAWSPVSPGSALVLT